MSQIENHDALQFVIKTANNQYGPFPSRAIAEAQMAMLALTEAATIVPYTSTGKVVLFG